MKFPLRIKTIILIVLVAALISTVSIVVNNRFTGNLVDADYRKRADEIAHMVALSIDAGRLSAVKTQILDVYNATEDKVLSDDWGSPEFEAYTARYDGVVKSQDYQVILEQLKSLQEVIDVDCLYTGFVEPNDVKMIYLVDAAEEDACPPGCIDPLYEENHELLTNPDRGFPPYITNTEPYGWLVTAGAPVYDETGNVVGYAMVDISMDVLRAEQREFTFLFAGVLAALTFLICIFAILAVDRVLIRPINALSTVVTQYSAGEDIDGEMEKISIRTQDEVQSLYTAFRQMTQDINAYIENLINTGVGSKLAYNDMIDELNEEIRNGRAQFGMLMFDVNNLKKLNDTYGHEKGDVVIRNTSKLICDVFVHSPVFRIGGDEFVVVLKGNDYTRRDALLDKFDAESAKMKGDPWEQVSAAYGYALYEDEDSAEDVFRKADHVMYERKKATKIGRG